MLTFNDLTLPCPEGLTLAQLLDERSMDPDTIATAVNGRFVAATARPGIKLADGDRIEVVAPMQGG